MIELILIVYMILNGLLFIIDFYRFGRYIKFETLNQNTHSSIFISSILVLFILGQYSIGRGTFN